MFGFKFMSLLNHVKLFLDFIGCHLCLLHKWLINLLSVICWVSLQISGFIPLNWLSMLLGDKIVTFMPRCFVRWRHKLDNPPQHTYSSNPNLFMLYIVF